MNEYLKGLNKEQFNAVIFDSGPALVLAGPGSGKTRVLTCRVARLLDNGINPNQILLLTFTNKAANQMWERIKDLSNYDESDGKVTASTYHAFCITYLRKYSKLVNLDNNFTIIDNTDMLEVVKLIRESMGTNSYSNFPKGKELVSIFSSHRNTNRTIDDIVDYEYLQYRSFKKEINELFNSYEKYKIERNLVDYDDLLVKFLKLLEENENICRIISNQYKYIMVDEYQDSNYLQFRIIKELRKFDNKNILVVGDEQQCLPTGSKIRVRNGFKNIEDISIKDELIVANGNGETYITKPNEIIKKLYTGKLIKITTKTGKTIKTTPDHIIFSLNENSKIDENKLTLFGGDYICNKEYEGYSHKLSKEDIDISHFSYDSLFEYREAMKEEGVSIGINVNLTNVLSENFEFTLAKDLLKGYKVAILNKNKVIVDEIIEIEEIDYFGNVYDINIENYRNFFVEDICVHNCIYGFRGSDFKNILNFPKEFHGCTSIILNTNYRSNQEIVDVANSLIASAKQKFNKDLKATHSKGIKPALIEAETAEIEAKYILGKIKEYKKNGISLNEIAVLIRGSRDSSALEVLLNQSGLAYQKFGGIKFLERKHIKDIFSFLKLSQNEKDEISWFRIFQLYPYIGTTYAKKITEEILTNGIDILLDKKYVKKKYAEYFPEIHKTISDIKKLELNDQLEFLIEKYYFNLVEKTVTESNRKESTKDEMLADNKSNKIDSEVLFDMAKDYKDTNKFITDLTLEVPTITNEDEYLTISTIHSAKGLEYKIGFVINAIEGSFPSIRSSIQSKIAEEIEEERRVFYVAITRVKDDLYVTYPKTSYNYNGYVSNTVSRYLIENNTYKLFQRFRVR